MDRAIALNPRSVEPHCIAASVRIAKNEHFEAMEHLTEALELTSPIDFRRKSIEEVMNGTKLALKLGTHSPNTVHNVLSSSSSPSDSISSSETLDGEVVIEDEDEDQSVIGQHDGVLNDGNANAVSAQNVVDLPFDDAEFMNLQKDLTEQMCTIGGDEFQAKLMKLNEIPAVQNFQRKALKGEKPDYNDYMALMKDKKFKQYNDVMTKIAQNPKFESVTAKFAAMDWMGAYQELQKDPEALALYMKAFEALDDD